MDVNTSCNLLTTSSNQLANLIISEFTKSIHNNIFYRNRQGLIYNSVTVDFSNDKWNCNPRLFCNDQYGEQLYYPIILLCNDFGSMYEFKKVNLINGIITPKLDIISTLLTYYSITDEDL